MRDLYELYLELGHDVFEERIKKPMELYMHDNGNVISMNALNTIVANAMENSKLGEAGFDEHDIFSPPSIEEKIYFDDTLPPIYDDYNDSSLLLPPVMEDKFDYDYNIPPIFDSYFVEFAPTTTNKIDYALAGFPRPPMEGLGDPAEEHRARCSSAMSPRPSIGRSWRTCVRTPQICGL